MEQCWNTGDLVFRPSTRTRPVQQVGPLALAPLALAPREEVVVCEQIEAYQFVLVPQLQQVPIAVQTLLLS